MPRKRSDQLSIEQAVSDYVVLDRGLQRHQEAEAWFWHAVATYRSYCVLVLREGDATPAAIAAHAAVEAQLVTAAELVFEDPRVAVLWRDVVNVCDVLRQWLIAALGGPLVPVQSLRLARPKGARAGSVRSDTRVFDRGLDEFEEKVREARRRLGQGAPHVRVWLELGMAETTYYRYLAAGEQRRQERRRYTIGDSKSALEA